MPTLHFLVPGSLTTPTGGYVYDRHIVAGLRALGWQVVVRQLDDGFPFPSAGALANAETRLAALPDDALVMIDGLAFGAMPECAARHAERLRLVALVHHPLALETGLTADAARWLETSERRALGCARRVIVTSPRTAATLAGWHVPPARIAVVEPGVVEPGVAGPGADAPAMRPQRRPAEAPRLLCIATLTERKGHALLFDALAQLGTLPWSLRCIGSRDRSPGTTERLEKQLRQSALAQRVVLAGELPESELAAAYAAADLFVLPTLYEGYGMVVAEAIAHGLPVVATATGAIPELVPADAGVVVAPGDGPALRAALAELLGDRRRLSRLTEGARRAAANARHWEQAADEIAALLGEIAA
ncbi:MAG: glycosyltransferase family 4 protein [Burkholderiaceae bacterium]